MKVRIVLVLLLALLMASSVKGQPPIEIVTTTTQVTDLTKILVGDLLDEVIILSPLMGAGVDPHLYTPTESDVAAMSRADAVFHNGLFLEGRMGELFEALGERNVVTYAVSQPVKDAGFTIGGFNLSEEFSNVDDPHFWFDPRNWEMAAIGLAEELGKLDPANADVYLANAEAYVEQLVELYAWMEEAMSQVPEEKRILVTSHDAFQYFGDAVSWEVRGLQGISTESEAGVADIQELARFIVEHDIPVIFIESSVPPNAIRAVQEAVRSEGGMVEVGERVLFSDAMGSAGEFGGTYIGMLATNVITIVQGFGYEVPPFPESLGVLPDELLPAN
jgi:manganese/zinc/iron transport system substrate-binding protein